MNGQMMFKLPKCKKVIFFTLFFDKYFDVKNPEF